MNIDRYMVNLFFEIKRNLPDELRKTLKISSPALGKSMIMLYQQSDDESIKRLIEVFLERAGEGWCEKLKKESTRKHALGISKFASQASSFLKENRITQKEQTSTPKPRYYRGVLVE